MQLGYLGLILDKDTYLNIPGATRFVRPTDPGIFQVAIPTERTRTRTTVTPSQTITAVDIANQKARHEENECQYYKCQAVEQAPHNCWFLPYGAR